MEENKKIFKVGVVSLGCDKNRVDTENMMTYLQNSGKFEFVGESADADIIIINTCAFIQSARTESQEAISEMAKFKKEGVCKCLVVTGCYPQKYINELTINFPEVDIFLGTNEYVNIVKIISDFLESENKSQVIKNDSPHCIDAIERGRLITTPSHTAYLRIADGCDNFCSYCTIPYIRGRYRSRKMDSIILEAEDLVQNGAKEIILVAQDVAKYGSDLYGELKLPELLNKLSKIDNLEWIRLLYCYPENITDELISEIQQNKKVCKYIDVPFQHISDNILKAMNRKINSQEVKAIINKLISGVPGIAIRSTFILGFPGETKENFKELLEFIKEYKLPNVGFFTYSREDGTVAARLPDQVDETTKNRRLLKAVKAQKKIVTAFNKSLIGETMPVILEGFDENKGLYYGRTQYQAPEIDTEVYFTSDSELMLGNIYDIMIVKVKGYDLYATTI